MTLDEAIKHAEEVADEKKKEACNLFAVKNYEEARECIWCEEEHQQLAEWLKDYKRFLEQEPILDKIRAEIGKSKTKHELQLAGNDIKGKLLISDIYCDIVNILDNYKAEMESKGGTE